jgi:methylmalonyl-CoA mutase N-terminal domain/subunit
MSERRQPRLPDVSASGIPIKGSYGPADVARIDPARDIGEPGEYPFVRGIHSAMYRERLWTMRQYAGFGVSEDTNARFRFLLSQGQTGLSLAFDLPTQIGHDSDDPSVEDEVGRVGVAVDTVDDMERLFADIPLDRVSTSFTINATAAPILAMYLLCAERRGIGWDRLRGTIQNDILKEYVARGTYIFPPRPSLRLAGDTVAFCVERAPKFYPISVSGGHMSEAGASPVQELAYTLADAIAYVGELVGRGIDVDRFAPRLSFLFCTHQDFFEEVAKYRAARTLWASIMRERFGARAGESLRFRVFAGGGGSDLAQREPLNNIVRTTLKLLAGVLGGVQSATVTPYDEFFALPTEESQRIALRTQQIVAYETGIPGVADPLGGSYYVEWLTREVADAASAIIREIDAGGGMVAAIERGDPQRAILERAYRIQAKIASGEKPIVGVNCFVDESQEDVQPGVLHRPSPEAVARQRERVAEARRRRDGAGVERALAALGKAAEGTANLFPFILEAVRCRATIGEVTNALRRVFGEYKAPAGL